MVIFHISFYQVLTSHVLERRQAALVCWLPRLPRKIWERPWMQQLLPASRQVPKPKRKQRPELRVIHRRRTKASNCRKTSKRYPEKTLKNIAICFYFAQWFQPNLICFFLCDMFFSDLFSLGSETKARKPGSSRSTWPASVSPIRRPVHYSKNPR